MPHLSEIHLFGNLPKATVDAIDAKVEWRDVSKGEYLFYEGDTSVRLYLVGRGAIKIVKEFPNGKNAILGIFGPGTTVAEVAVVDGKPYPASAVAQEDSTVGALDSNMFMEVLRQEPEVAIQLVSGLGAKLRELTMSLSAMAVETVEKRLARFLVKLAGRIGEAEGGQVSMTLPLTRRDIAEIIGASFEVVERSLKKLKERGVIAVEGKEVTILDIDRLQGVYDEGE
jgi:CRP/FNR family transcriptional regulator